MQCLAIVFTAPGLWLTHRVSQSTKRVFSFCYFSHGCINKVITDLALLAIKDGAFHLLECAPGVTIDEIKAKTAGNLVISDKVKTMSFE